MPHLGRVITQKVHRLTQFGHRVGEGLAGFAHQQRAQPGGVGLQAVGRRVQPGGTFGGQRGGPAWRGGLCGGQRGLHVVGRGLLHRADGVSRVGRVQHALQRAGRRCGCHRQQGQRLPDHARAIGQRLGQRAELRLAGQVQPGRVQPRRTVERAGQRDRGMRRAGHALGRGLSLDRLHRVFNQQCQRQLRVGDAVDEGGVGAVLQQPAHQVGQQGFVAADRRIDAARPGQLTVGQRADHLLVEWLAHAVQALKLVLTGRVLLARQRVHGGQGVRVVGGELRVDRVGRGQQSLGASQVGHVGVGLAGVDRVVSQAIELRPLDLAVPVGALDQPHHQPALAAPGQGYQVVDHCGAAFGVGLDHKTDAVPARQRRVSAQRFQQVERQFQPITFFGVDVQADVVPLRQPRQQGQPRAQLGHYPPDLGTAVARVQRRQLDRDARAFVDATPGRGLADGVDGLLVGRQVARRVGRGQRGLAQHVVRVAEAGGLARPGVGQRLGDGLAGDELLAHHAQGHVNALAHQRLAAAADEAAQRRAQARVAVAGHQPASQQQTPGGGVDKQRGAAPQVLVPVAVADLVADQRVAGRRIGDAQQRLGQTHQRHAFLRRQRKFLQQPLHQAGPATRARPLTHPAGDAQRQRLRLRGLRWAQAGAGQQAGQQLRLGAPGGRADRRAQRRGHQHRREHRRQRRRQRRRHR